MTKKSFLFRDTPFAIENTLNVFGANLLIARKRRKLSAQQVADKLGIDRRSVTNAEKGKPTTAISIYIGLLWAYDLLDDMKNVALPTRDAEGLRLANKLIKALDNDF